MRLLLQIFYPGSCFRRVVVNNRESVTAAIEAADPRFRLCENVPTLDRIGRIMEGKVRPVKDFIAGNAYFGKAFFRYTRPDQKDGQAVQTLYVKVFSALGTTVEEHDERYRRLKELKNPVSREEDE